MLPVVEQVRAGLDTARGAGLAGVGEDELGTLVSVLAVIESQAAALRLAVLAEAEARQVAAKAAVTGTDAWAASLTGDTREAAAGGLRIARLLAEKYPHTREAYAAGLLRTAQVRVIVNAAEQAPPEATAEQVSAAEEILVAKATGAGTRTGRPMNARRLRQAARRMFDPLDHDLADRHEAILLGRESAHARRETSLMLGDNGDGTWTGKFTIPELHGSLLRQALDRLTAPRRLGRNRGGQPVVDESAAQGDHGGLGGWEAAGQALCELIEHLPTTGWQGANAMTFLVTIPLDQLAAPAGSPGAGRLDTGIHVDAGELRRLACEAGHVPAVLGGDSKALDLGRRSRLPQLLPAPRTLPRVRLLRHHRLRTTLRLVRDPPPPPLVPRRPHRPGQRHPPLRLAPPPRPRPHLDPQPRPHRRRVATHACSTQRSTT